MWRCARRRACFGGELGGAIAAAVGERAGAAGAVAAGDRGVGGRRLLARLVEEEEDERGGLAERRQELVVDLGARETGHAARGEQVEERAEPPQQPQLGRRERVGQRAEEGDATLRRVVDRHRRCERVRDVAELIDDRVGQQRRVEPRDELREHDEAEARGQPLHAPAVEQLAQRAALALLLRGDAEEDDSSSFRRQHGLGKRHRQLATAVGVGGALHALAEQQQQVELLDRREAQERAGVRRWRCR